MFSMLFQFPSHTHTQIRKSMNIRNLEYFSAKIKFFFHKDNFKFTNSFWSEFKTNGKKLSLHENQTNVEIVKKTRKQNPIKQKTKQQKTSQEKWSRKGKLQLIGMIECVQFYFRQTNKTEKRNGKKTIFNWIVLSLKSIEWNIFHPVYGGYMCFRFENKI